MRNAVDGFMGSIKSDGTLITKLRYADHLDFIAGSMKELPELVDRVKDARFQFGTRRISITTKKRLLH